MQVQALGEFLEKNCPSVSVKYVIKHKTEWADFLDAVSLILVTSLSDLPFLRFREEILSPHLHD